MTVQCPTKYIQHWHDHVGTSRLTEDKQSWLGGVNDIQPKREEKRINDKKINPEFHSFLYSFNWLYVWLKK